MTQRRIYQCAFPYHITFNILGREWFFSDEEKARLLYEIILNAGDIKNHIIYQFCIMPDHVHLLCRPNEQPISDIGIYGRNSINNIKNAEIGKNTAGAEAPQCFFKGISAPSPNRADLRVCDGDVDDGILRVCDGEVDDGILRVCDGEVDDGILRVCDGEDELDLGFLLETDKVPKTMTNLMHSIKSYFVCEMRKILDVEYKFFQSRFNYKIVTNDKQLRNVISYISHNPIKAGLPEKWNNYPYQYKNDELINELFS